tara:strand:+ start:469 stop:1632 length:1164 start_codon:yes stop_codon:yes gene_type:complete
MVPQLMAHFHASAKEIGFLSAMYYYAYTPLQLVVAVLTDFYGSRRMLLFALVNCVIGCFIFASSHLLWQADTGRLFIGVGSAFAFVATLRLAAMWLPKKHFMIFIGLTTSLGMVGAMVGDVGMSWAVKHWGWLSVVYISLGVGLLLIPLFYFFIAENPESEGLGEAKALGLGDYCIELGRAMIHPQLIMLGVIGASLYFSLSVFADMWGIPYLQQTSHLSKIHAASMNAIVYLAWLIGAPLHGWLSGYFKDLRWYLLASCALTAACFFVLLQGVSSVNGLGVLLFAFGFFASAEVICLALAKECLPKQFTATAIGVLNCFIMLGGLVLLPVIGMSLDQHWTGQLDHGVRIYSSLAFYHALFPVFIMLLVSMVVALFINVKSATSNYH